MPGLAKSRGRRRRNDRKLKELCWFVTQLRNLYQPEVDELMDLFNRICFLSAECIFMANQDEERDELTVIMQLATKLMQQHMHQSFLL